MSLQRLATSQWLPVPLAEAWAFFADPRNLGLLTPPSLRFELTSEPPPEMYRGLIVSYRLRPLLGAPVSWVSEISQLEEGRMFVDEQRLGPYRFWHHQHHFGVEADGTRARDIVHYALPFGPLGDLANAALVRPRLRAIFAYRREVLSARFGRSTAALATGRAAG